jgi:Tol biopolymer transport system component
MNIIETMKPRGFTTLLLLVLIQSSVIAASSDDATYRIIFRSAMDAPSADPDFQENPQRYFELYTMNCDGSDIQRVTHNAYYENQPDVSPDGKTVVCSVHLNASRASGTDPGWEIALIDMETGEMTLLTDNDYLDYGAHWNHDGTKIVYVSDSAQRNKVDVENQVPLRYDVYTMNADGSDKTQLTFAEAGDVNADPSFSFNAPSRILYIHSEGYSGAFDLYTMDHDGENKVLVRSHDEQLLALNDPMFSPDGTRIVFGAKVRESAEGNPIYNVFTVGPSGGDLTRITADDGESDVIPQYSPDGGWIAYYTYVWENGGNTHRIRVVRSDGTDEKTLSTYPWESGPSWYTAHHEEMAQQTDDEPTGGTGIPGFGALSTLVAILCFFYLKQRTNQLKIAEPHVFKPA